jgi:hypothetical protein
VLDLFDEGYISSLMHFAIVRVYGQGRTTYNTTWSKSIVFPMHLTFETRNSKHANMMLIANK